MIQTDVKAKVEHFFSQFHLQAFKKGELILQPEENDGVFFLKEGFVREYGISPQGIEVGIHIYVPHSYFPMMWVVADISNRYYFEALTNVQLYNTSKDKVLAFIKENPDVLFDLTKRVLKGLDKLTSRIEFLSYGKAYEKVVSIILYLANHFGEEKNKKIHIKYKFTHRDIGSLAGITRETTSREWEKLVNKGLITYKNQFIVIPNIEKLQMELSG